MKKILFILVTTLLSQTIKAQYYYGGYNAVAMDMALMQLQMQNAQNMAYQYQNMPPATQYNQQYYQPTTTNEFTPYVETTPSNSQSYNNSSYNQSSNNTRPCNTCRQTGVCQGCNGRGTIKAYTYNSTETLTCPNCNGSRRCQWCGGDGIKGN